MTIASIIALGALVIATAVLGLVVRRIGRETGLGLIHPAAVWMASTIVFFGIGAIVLAAQGRPGPAAYIAGAVLAVAIAAWASARVADRRAIAGAATVPEPRAHAPGVAGTLATDGIRVPIVVGMAVLALLAIAPTLLRTGLPFLVQDITGARVELAGLAVQLPRVALPGLAGVALLIAIAHRSARSRAVAAAVIAAVAAFEILLASRYLVAELAVVLVLTWCLTGRRIPPALIVIGAIGGLGLFAGIQVMRTWDQAASEPVAFAIGRTIDRIVLIGPRTLDALMMVIPAEQDHFGGLTWVRRLAPLLGRDDVPNLGYWIFSRVIPGGTGYAAPGWLGEAWANLGWAGLALFGLMGVALERLGALISVRRAMAVDIVAFAMFVLFMARTHALGLLGVAVLVVLVAVWRLAAGPAGGLLQDLSAIARWRPARTSGATSA